MKNVNCLLYTQSQGNLFTWQEFSNTTQWVRMKEGGCILRTWRTCRKIRWLQEIQLFVVLSGIKNSACFRLFHHITSIAMVAAMLYNSSIMAAFKNIPFVGAVKHLQLRSEGTLVFVPVQFRVYMQVSPLGLFSSDRLLKAQKSVRRCSSVRSAERQRSNAWFITRRRSRRSRLWWSSARGGELRNKKHGFTFRQGVVTSSGAKAVSSTAASNSQTPPAKFRPPLHLLTPPTLTSSVLSALLSLRWLHHLSIPGVLPYPSCSYIISILSPLCFTFLLLYF